MAKLSQTQFGAMQALQRHGELIRRPGGFWTAESTPMKNEVPEWYFGAGTIHALIARGLAKATAHLERGEAWKVAPVAEATETDQAGSSNFERTV